MKIKYLKTVFLNSVLKSFCLNRSKNLNPNLYAVDKRRICLQKNKRDKETIKTIENELEAFEISNLFFYRSNFFLM